MSLLEAVRVGRVFPIDGPQKRFEALKDVSIHLEAGESVGVLGESGSGKSTLAAIFGGLDRPTSGQVLYKGRDIATLKGGDWKCFRQSVQYIFQDPKAAMNPYFTLRQVLMEPLKVNRKELSKAQMVELVEDMTARVGLPTSILSRHPDEVSGGQAQRVITARALLLEPEVIIADECVSALDLSIQAQIINLLRRIRSATGASFLFISHDADLVRYFCDRSYVMLHGRIVEELGQDLSASAKSEYTRMLLGGL